MKPEYDFKGGVRGMFFHDNASLHVPVYLEPEVLKILIAEAEQRGVTVDEIVNELLKRDIAMGKTRP